MGLIEPFAFLARHQRLLLSSTLVELRTQYAGSVLGLAWVLVSPLLLVGLYAAVYSVIFRVSLPGMSGLDYVLLVAAGLSAFTAFGATLGNAAAALIRNKALLVSTTYPAELLPARAVLVACPQLLVGLILVSLVSPMLGKASVATVCGAWMVALLQVLFMCGLAWVLSLVTLAIRDLQHVLQYLVTVLLIITPIGYTVSMVPAALMPVVNLNPLAHFVLAYQDLLVFGRWPRASEWALLVVGSVLPYLIGFWFFRRVRLVFYDYV
jgi:lipopolysaccharide transport system permease protein